MLATALLLVCTSVLAASNEKVIYVSDIDDTIVQSNVANKLALIKTALFRKPKNAFDGMAVLYENLLKENPNASIVYVSGTPELMRKGVTSLLARNRFPKGRMILRRWFPFLSDITWGWIGDTILSSKKFKLRALRKLMRENPDAKFVFLGDDVEYDADVYRQMDREFPGMVKQIYIRRVIGRLPLENENEADKLKQFSTEWNIGYSEYEADRLSGDRLLEIGNELLKRARTQPQLVYPRFLRSFIGFQDTPLHRKADLSFLAVFKALAYDLGQVISTVAHCQLTLLGVNVDETPKSPPKAD
ncbi:MAG: DUF2183 domain-containing protein [Deltaproteobacteria bacterium]|nr:DUF2183 domain-containing protein [Deltaproteobacteria bacterium]